MSIRNSLLALLLEGRAYGNQLRTDFEERTGGSWPLNIGQVYQTLDRLVRDGLVVAEEVHSADIPAQARSLYRITDAGQAEVLRWFAEPVARGSAPRDELTIKLAVAMCSPRADVGRIIDVQRTATMRALQELTALMRSQLAGDPDPVRAPWMLILDRLIFDTEAELRWLEHCESTLLRNLTASTKGGPS
ncbi:MAG: PadR family transcriptional regulator [Candidatus Nanopelagicales bacterium]|nr:PadR family transcriptional regulator [Candidatus Nanopelagicales bacterium]